MDKFDNLTKFDDFLKDQLKDPNVKAEYDGLESEFVVIRSIIEARLQKGLTQKELSKLSGISQADISRIECGTANPSLKTLQRLATALERKVVIEFV